MTKPFTELFNDLKAHYGTHTRAAKALNLPRRTYYDWKNDRFARDTQRKRARSLIENALANSTPQPQAGA